MLVEMTNQNAGRAVSAIGHRLMVDCWSINDQRNAHGAKHIEMIVCAVVKRVTPVSAR
jgi:hypothetical protein